MTHHLNTSLQRRTVPAGTFAYVYRSHKGGEPHPHLSQSKPFTTESKAWCIVEAIRSPGRWERLTSSHTEFLTPFRNKAHAEAWYALISEKGQDSTDTHTIAP